MKKSLLFCAAVASFTSAFAAAPVVGKADMSAFDMAPLPSTALTTQQALTRAEGEMQTLDFSYAGSPAGGYSLNGTTGGKTLVYMAFQMKEADIKIFAGSKVTGFNVYSPKGNSTATNTITSGHFFYSFDLSKEDYSQDFEMSNRGLDLNRISINEPYTITGEEESIYFGYCIKVPASNNMYYLQTDGVPNFPGAGIYGSSNDGTFPKEFYTFAGDIGALCMSVVLERESLPQFASFVSVPSVICVPKGQAWTQRVYMKATSANPVESVGVEYVLDGKSCKETYVLDPAVGPGSEKYFSIPLKFPALDNNVRETVEFKITEINGVSNESDAMTANALVATVDKVPVHQTLYEEFTGTWCGFCPKGFAALEYIGKNYPEFVVASYHCGTHDNYGRAIPDPMEVTTKFPVSVPGFPMASLNRNGELYDPYFGSQTYDYPVPIVGDMLAFNESPTVWNVSVAHEWTSDDVLTAKAEVSNVLGYDNETYKIAYLLIADGLTSFANRYWAQTNNYSTYPPEYVEEFNNFCRGGIYGKSTVPGLVFNDVVVSANGIYGEAGSVPASMTAGQTAEHSLNFDLSKISTDLIPDRNKLRVIAAVVDKDGKVLNCAKDEVNDFDPNAVDDILDEAAPVEYYNLSGMKVANPSSGLFIRRQGSRSSKVVIP